MKVKLPFCIILLMIAGVAWADSKVLWRGNSPSCGEHFHGTPEAARKACGYTRKGWRLEKRGELTYEMGWYNEDGSFYKWTGANVFGHVKSCELKDIPGSGSNGTHNIGLKGDKAPNMVRRCINNCEVEDRRVKKEGAAAGADYGGVVCAENPVTGEKYGCAADYTRIQTGAVCTLKPGEKDDTKYDDVTANPGDGNSNGADGKGKDDGGGNGGQSGQEEPPKQDGRDDSKSDGRANGSDGSGNQSGGQGREGADSPRDSGSADDPVEDKDKDKDKDKNKDKDKPGKGKGKGGRGGGNHGDKDKDDKDDKDKTDDGKGGDPKGGEGKGDGKGDGKDGGKDGKDKADGSPNGTDNGTGAGGDKDGQGSGISGGDCKSGKAPSCKGDPVQCYIAREQWRTACLAERGGGSVSGGSCKNNQPPECKGDPTQCYIVKQQFYQGCEAARAQQERDGIKDYVGGKSGVVAEVDGSSMDGVGKTLAGNSREQNITDILDLGGYGWSRSCPAITAVDMGKWGRFELDGAPYCTIANLIGNILVALSLLFSVRYMFA